MTSEKPMERPETAVQELLDLHPDLHQLIEVSRTSSYGRFLMALQTSNITRRRSAEALDKWFDTRNRAFADYLEHRLKVFGFELEKETSAAIDRLRSEAFPEMAESKRRYYNDRTDWLIKVYRDLEEKLEKVDNTIRDTELREAAREQVKEEFLHGIEEFKNHMQAWDVK